MGAKIELQVTYVTHIMKCAKKKNLTQVKGLLGTYQRLFTMYVPKISAPAVSLGKKWGWTVLEIKVSSSQWEGSARTHEPSNFFSSRKTAIFWFFRFSQCVPIMFSMSSQILKGFPSFQSVFKCIPQDIPNSTWVLSHMICPKLNSPVYKYKTQRYTQG